MAKDKPLSGSERGRIKPSKLKSKTVCYTFYLLWLIEKELDDVVSALGVVEEDKKGPVNEPCPLLEGLKRGGDRLDGRKFGRHTRAKNGTEGEKGPRAGKQNKVQFNMWFVIFIVKLRCCTVSTKERQSMHLASSWP